MNSHPKPARSPLPSLLPDFPSPPYLTRRIVVSNTVACPHCRSRSFMLDPDLGVLCTQCAKNPRNPPKEKTPFP